MGLDGLISKVERQEKTLTVFDPPSGQIVEELREWFHTLPVVVYEGSASGLSGRAVLADGNRALAAVDLHDLTAEDGRARTLRTLLEHLDGTTFSSYDTDQMVATSREIEDRAWRSGTGALHAGFQRVSALSAEATIYRDLARKTLDIHAYAIPDRDPPDLGDVTLHLTDDPEIERTWFVVFDGGDAPSDKCALLAEERDDRRFYGFWTYDEGLVDDVLNHLRTRYLVPS